MSPPEQAGPEDPFAHTRMTLGEHLDELRTRLFRGIVALVACFVVGLVLNRQVTTVVLQPFHEVVADLNAHNVETYEELTAEKPELRDEYFTKDGEFRFLVDGRLTALSPTEGMWFVLKIAGYAAVFFGAPFLLWQLWQFVAAGLYERERRWVRWFFPPGLVLFFAGVLFSYFVLAPLGMFFLMQTAPLELVNQQIRLEAYFGFLATLCLGMGLVFQLPILMTFAGLTGMVDHLWFARGRGYFLVIAVVVAAILTPPDPYSQILMAIPMVLLYEIGIIGARVAGRRQQADLVERSAP